MIDATIVISYKDKGCPHRAAAYEWTLDYYQQTDAEIIVEGEGSRPVALNTGIRRAGGNIIVQADADSLIPLDRLEQAIAMAGEQDGLVVPFNRYLYLTPEATELVYEGEWAVGLGPDDCEEVGDGGGVGNVTVFSRHTWETAGGYDERFVTWGGDDAAFAYAAHAFFGILRRIPGDMVHLWHPRAVASVPGTPEYQAQFAIVAEYRDAAEDPDAIRAILKRRYQ